MATFNYSNTCNGNHGSRYTLNLSIIVGESVVSTMQTPITLRLTRTRESDLYYNYGYSNPTTLTINGTTVATATPTSSHNTIATQTLIEVGGIIYHDSEGKASYITIGGNTVKNITNNKFTVGASFTSSSPSLSGGSVSGEASVNSIDVSINEITSINNFTYSDASTIVKISKANSSYTTRLKYYLKDGSNESSMYDITTGTNSSTYTWTFSSQDNDRFNTFFAGKITGQVVVVATTYNGSTRIGTTDSRKTATITIKRKNLITNVSSFILGLSNPTITIAKANSALTTTLTYTIGSLTGTIVSKTSSTSYKWTLGTTLINNIKSKYPSATEVNMTITATTYNGNDNYGQSSYDTMIEMPIPNRITSVTSFELGLSNPIITINKTNADFTTTLEYSIGDGALTGTIDTNITDSEYEWALDFNLIDSINDIYSSTSEGILKVIATTTYNGTRLSEKSEFTQTFGVPQENTIEVNSFILGEENPVITIQKSDESYTTTLSRQPLGDENETVIIAENINATSYEWILSDSEIEKILSSVFNDEGSFYIYATTYSGDTKIGFYQYECRFVVSDIYKPTVTNVAMTELNGKVAMLTDKIVRYQSVLEAVVGATAGKNRTIETYTADFNSILWGNTYSETNRLMIKNEKVEKDPVTGEEVYFDNLLTEYYVAEDGITNLATYKFYATNDKGLESDAYELTRGFVPYINLTLDNYQVDRLSSTSNYINFRMTGNFFDSDELGKQNDLIISYRYREKGTDAWIKGQTNFRRNREIKYINGRYTVDAMLAESFGYNKAWEFEFYVNDLLLNFEIKHTIEAELQAFISRFTSGRSRGYGLVVTNEDDDFMILSDNDDFSIEYLDGFYSLGATISTTKIGTVDGEKLSARSVNKRNIGIYLYIKKNVSQNRISLYKIFKAKRKVKLSYYSKNRQVAIEGYVEDITITPHQQITQAQIVIVCPKPFLQNIEDVIVDLDGIKKNFYFPYYVTDAKKAMGYNLNTTAKQIRNTSDYETGMIVSLKATEAVRNPYIFDENNNTFQLGTASNPFNMKAGDELIINTETKTVRLKSNGVETNVFNYIAPNSKWLKLKVGDNIIDYSNADKVKMKVKITYNYKYEGV